MKKYLLTFAVSALIGSISMAQETPVQIQDTTTVVVESDTTKNRNINIKVSVGKSDDEETKKKITYPRTFGGLTFSRIDWGFSRPIQDGSFTMSGDNEFMQYGRASNFGFDVAQFGVRLNDNFRIYASAGFEWNYMRLKNNVLLHQGEVPLGYTVVDRNEVNYRKNILTSTYLRAPVTFEWRSARNRKGDRLKVAFGPMTGILLKGSQRLKSDEQGKQGFKDNYNLQSFQYGGFVRVGYGHMGVFAKYYMNDMFENSPAQEGMNNFAFGLTLGF